MTKITHYAVYDHPTDYPDEFVVRKWFIDKTGGIVPDEQLFLQSKNLGDIQSKLKDIGLYRMPRFSDDDPVIVEVWYSLNNEQNAQASVATGDDSSTSSDKKEIAFAKFIFKNYTLRKKGFVEKNADLETAKFYTFEELFEIFKP